MITSADLNADRGADPDCGTAPEEPGRSPTPVDPHQRLGWLRDTGAALAYLSFALYVTSSLWANLGTRAVAGYGVQDQVLSEWYLAHAARSVADFTNPFVATQQNVPFGVHMMTNNNMLGLGIPLSPVTLAFGPTVSFTLLVTLALAGTASAWYWVFSRNVVSSRLAAFVGAALCGFAPGMISQSLGHTQVISQFVTPLIAIHIIRLRRTEHALRNAVVLALLVVCQVFISEEVLFFTGLATGLFIALSVALRPSLLRETRQFLRGCAIALAVALPLLAYPLYLQFLGPGRYHGLPFNPELIYMDLGSFTAFPSNSLAGVPTIAAHLAHSTGEEATFFGWPLLLVLVGLVAWLWRGGDHMPRVAAICAVVFLALSLGYRVILNGEPTGVPGPFRLLAHLPLFDLAVAARFAMVAIPFMGLILALAVQRSFDATGEAIGSLAWWRPAAVIAAIVGASVPLIPGPLPTDPLPPIPRFITAGTWRSYVPDGRTLVAVPTPSSFHLDGIRWSNSTNLDMAIPRGYFLAPSNHVDRRPLYGAVPTFSSVILDQVALSGVVYQARPGDAYLFTKDLRLWRASVLVLAPHQPNAEALRTTVIQFLGAPRRVDDVWIWEVNNP